MLDSVISPGATLGILGGGQLGRMFVCAARTMGYEVIVYDPDIDSPAGSLATEHIKAQFDDQASLQQLADKCDVITIEFENIPLSSIRYLEERVSIYPSANAVEISQNRSLEKSFLQGMGLKTAPFVEVTSLNDCDDVSDDLFPAILKTSEFGYDGKGQVVCANAGELKAAFIALNQVTCVLEKKVNLKAEVSVIVCRGLDGRSALFPVAENQHVNGILDTSIVPASVSELMAKRAQKQAQKIADELDYCGVLAVEFFITDKDGLLINEIAPRPHNSGHFTLDACVTTQFEQQVRMICGLPAGRCHLLSPVVMWNILGDIWPENGDSPDWSSVLEDGRAKLHLYGKKEARKGRKMGHINVLCKKIDVGLERKNHYVKTLS